MATKSAGRVSIRVLPDSTGFRSDLKKALDRIEKSVKAKIPVDLVLDRAQLAKIKEQIESLKIKLRPDIDLSVSADQVSKLKAQIERIKPKISIDLATATAAAEIEALTRTRDMRIDAYVSPESLAALEATIRDQQMHLTANLNDTRARAQLLTLTRPRRVSITPDLNNAALAKVLAKLMGIGGLNVLGDAFRDGSNFITKIDTMMVKTAQLSLLILGISSAITSIVGNLMVASSDLLKIGNLGWLAPGFLTGTAIALTITGVALADMGKRLKDLQPRMERLKQSIRDTFWAEAEKPIRSMFENIYPRLFAPDDTKNTSAEMGKFVGEIAASIERNLPPGLLEKMFLRMNEAIAVSRDAINPLMHAFITMGEIGTRFMGRFATWIVKISTQFDNFVTKSAGNGDMVRWIESGIQSLKDLGSLTRGTYRILSEVTDAFRKSGAKGLGEWADDFNAAADAMARPEFKEPLAAFFRSMREGSDGLVDMLRNMGPGVASFVVGPLNRAMVAVAEIFRTAGTYISEVLDNPKFQQGFSKMFEGFLQGFENLAPAVKPMADSLGGVMVLLGRISGAVGDLLATFTVMWGPQFDRLGEQIETLIDPLSLSLRQAIVNLTPLLDSFITKVATPLVAVIRDNLLPLFDQVARLLPAISPLFDSIGRVFEQGLGPLIDSITDALKRTNYEDVEDIFRTIGEIIEVTLIPLLGILKESFDGMSAKNIKDELESVKTLLETIKGIIDTVTGLLSKLDWGQEGGRSDSIDKYYQDKYQEALGNAKPREPGWFSKFWDGLTGKDLAKDLEENINKGVDGGLEKSEGGFKKWLKGLFGGTEIERQLKEGTDYTPKIRGGGTKFSRVYIEELTALQQLHKDWDTFWGAAQVKWDIMGDSFAQTWADISTNAAIKWLEIKAGFTTWLADLRLGWDEFWLGVATYAITKWEEIKLGIATWMAGIKVSWDEFWTGVGIKAFETWNEIKTWIDTKAAEITLSIAQFIADTKANWDEFWLGVALTVITKWNEIKTWIDTKATEIAVAIEKFITDTKTNWDTAWTEMALKVVTKWNEIKTAITTKYNEILQGIKTWLDDTKSNISNAWQHVKATTSRAWEQVVEAIRTEIDNAITWVKELPQRAVRALSGSDQDLRGSGQSLISGFISGMNDMANTAAATASSIMARIRAFFPFSPAKEGPFSGFGYTTHSGAALVRDFAGGMMDNMDLAREAARKVSEAAKISSQIDLDTDIGDQGITIDRRSVKVDIHNPIAEPTSKTITTASNRLTMRKK